MLRFSKMITNSVWNVYLVYVIAIHKSQNNHQRYNYVWQKLKTLTKFLSNNPILDSSKKTFHVLTCLRVTEFPFMHKIILNSPIAFHNFSVFLSSVLTSDQYIHRFWFETQGSIMYLMHIVLVRRSMKDRTLPY